MGEVVRGTMDAEGDAEWANEPMKPTWEQVVAMQKESAALRAQAAAVLPALPAGVTPRSRRAPSRNEYPLFIPSYRDPPLLSGSQQMFLSESLQGQNLGNPAGEDSFRGRLLERRQTFGGDFRTEIVPADSGNSANKPQPFSAISRHVHSHRSHSLNMGLSPEISQLTGHTPKSTVSGISDATNAPITPASHSRNMFIQEDAVRKQTLNPGESSRGPVVRQVRDIGHRGRGNHTEAASPTDASLWKGCSGGLSMVAPFAEGTPAAGSGMDASPLPQVSRRAEAQQPTEKSRPQQQAGLFGFLPWGKKTSNVGQAASDRKQTNWEKDSSKDLEKLIKNLQSQLEQADKQRLTEVRELQLMLKDMQEKFEQLHAHCRNLERQMSKQARHTTPNTQEYHVDEDDSSSLESGSVRAVWQRSIPHPSITPDLFITTYDAAVANLRRLSRAICVHIREMGESASQVITAVLENHSIARGRLRKAQKILYFESFLNQIMFENFENVNFEPSGGAPVLDPEALQQLSFQSFQELESVSWLDIEQSLDEEQGVIVSHSFHQFFLVRMDIVLHQLGDVGETTMPPTVISAFFDAIKAVWLLHHLAFSFRPAATILRVSQGAKFEGEYMDQVHESDRESRAKSVFLMINPGFLIDDWVVKCRVYCSRK
ncbi:hypothetical protein M758_5G136300 [Ceratodon purpureus]|nr:hypothetical protein M758_5G136300 [Ceratodon purpureus]